MLVCARAVNIITAVHEHLWSSAAFTRLDNLVRHEGRHVGRFAEELVSPRGMSLPHQLHAALQVGLPPGPALLLLPSLGRQVAPVEDQVRFNPVTQE